MGFAPEQIGNIFRLHRGYELTEKDRTPGSVPVFGAADIAGWHNVEKIPGPNVITGRKGTIGKVNYYPDGCWPLDTTLYVEDFKKNDPLYVSYLLKYFFLMNDFNGKDQTSVPGINRNRLHKKEVPYTHDIEEQQTLSSCLHRFDQIIQLNNSQSAELSFYLTIIYDYWFTQFDFPDENGNPYRQSGGKLVHNEELDRDLPIGWEVVKLGSIIEENDKSTIQVGQAEVAPGDYPFFTSGEKILPYEKSLVDGAFLYLNTGGLADVKFFSGPAAYSTDVWSIYGNDELTYWLYMFLNSIKPQMFQRFFDGSGLKHLQKKRLSSLKVCIPPMAIRQKFNEIAKPILKEQSDIYFENQQLAQLRDYLLPLLMSGQVVIKPSEEDTESE